MLLRWLREQGSHTQIYVKAAFWRKKSPWASHNEIKMYHRAAIWEKKSSTWVLEFLSTTQNHNFIYKKIYFGIAAILPTFDKIDHVFESPGLEIALMQFLLILFHLSLAFANVAKSATKWRRRKLGCKQSNYLGNSNFYVKEKHKSA